MYCRHFSADDDVAKYKYRTGGLCEWLHRREFAFNKTASPPEGHISIMPRTKVIDAATIRSNLRRPPEDEEQAAEKWKGLRNEEEKREVFLS